MIEEPENPPCPETTGEPEEDHNISWSYYRGYREIGSCMTCGCVFGGEI